MGNGSLNHSIFYLYHGFLPAITRFASDKYYEATCDATCLSDVEHLSNLRPAAQIRNMYFHIHFSTDQYADCGEVL